MKDLKTAVENVKDAINSEWINKHNYKIASHNTMTYLTPKNWFYRLVAFTARCQSENIYDQIEKYNVKMVDLRFRFNKKGEISFAHGAVEYKGDRQFIEDILFYLNSKKGFPARVMLENKDGEMEEEFCHWCQYIERAYPNIKFFGGRNKWTWKEIYKFKMDHPKLEDKYSSCNTDEPGKPQTGTYLDDLCPILYAKKNNKKNLANGTDREFMMIDFVEIR